MLPLLQCIGGCFGGASGASPFASMEPLKPHRLIDMAETKINKLPVLERRLHNYGQGMDFFFARSVSEQRFFLISCQAHPSSTTTIKKKIKLKPLKKVQLGLRWEVFSGYHKKKAKKLNKKYLAQFF